MFPIMRRPVNDQPAESVSGPRFQSLATPSSSADADEVALKPEAFLRNEAEDEYPLMLNPLHTASPCPKRAEKCPRTTLPSRRFPYQAALKVPGTGSGSE